MIDLYSPDNEIDLALIKSILDSEGINYFVRNDNFGSMEIGPQIELFNKKMIVVQKEHLEKAKELLDDYLAQTENKTEAHSAGYSLFDKLRMAVEVLIFGWLMPGKRRKN